VTSDDVNLHTVNP